VQLNSASDVDGWCFSSQPKKSRGVDVRGVTVRERVLVKSSGHTRTAYGYYVKREWQADRNGCVSDIKETKHEAIADLLDKENGATKL